MMGFERREPSLAVAAVLAAACLTALSCGGQPTASTGETATPGMAEIIGAGKIAPDFTLEDTGGRQVSLADSAGRVRLIDFWATWCAPCREELPMLKELHEVYADQGLEIMVISDESPKVLRTFGEQHEFPYKNLIGTDKVNQDYGVLSLPTAFLVDGDGKIVEWFMGPKPRKVLEGKIRELLELPPLT